jgi:hypothetical protein
MPYSKYAAEGCSPNGQRCCTENGGPVRATRCSRPADYPQTLHLTKTGKPCVASS